MNSFEPSDSIKVRVDEGNRYCNS